MQRSAPGFEATYRRHLAVEQRRAVLDMLAGALDPESTVGDLADASTALGWAQLGDLSLADLADALLGGALAARPSGAAAPADDAVEDEEEDAVEDEEDEDEQAAPAPSGKKRRAAAAPAKAAKAAKPAATKARPTAPAPAAKTRGGKPAKISLDDRMSPEEAAAVLIPLVQSIGEATMQQLEQSTAGAGRRKLRFHIGQLVKHGRLARHGMGRGTFYTVV